MAKSRDMVVWVRVYVRLTFTENFPEIIALEIIAKALLKPDTSRQISKSTLPSRNAVSSTQIHVRDGQRGGQAKQVVVQSKKIISGIN